MNGILAHVVFGAERARCPHKKIMNVKITKNKRKTFEVISNVTIFCDAFSKKS